jgi:intracellular multiplication protein IcmT
MQLVSIWTTKFLVTKKMNWRETARIPRILFMDARSLVPLLIFFFHMRLWTFVVAIVGITLFAILERLGFTLEILLRLIRVKVIGGYKPVTDPNLWRRRCRR